MILKSVAKSVLRKPYSFLNQKVIWEVNSAAKFRSAKAHLLCSDRLSGDEKALVKKVSCRVHPNDCMYAISSHEEYLSAGVSAARCIEYVVTQSAAHNNVRTILDFACGYGRVLRFLKAKFPAANITATDIDPEALNFCRRVFSVKTAVSSLDFNQLSISGRFDLIWCGSLITHIDRNAAASLLRFFHNHLSPNGVCIFTTHGSRAAESMQKYGLSETGQREVLSQFGESGYGYADYPGRHGIGISVVTHPYMLAIARSVGGWNQIAFLEHGWDNLQDVYGFAFLKTSGG